MGVLIGYAAWAAALIVMITTLPGFLHAGWALLAGSGVLAMMIGVLRNRPATKAPWIMLAIASLLSIAGHATQVIETDRMVNSPVPGISALLFLLSFPFYIAGFLAFIRTRGPVPDRRTTIDALIVTVGLTLLAWVFLVSPYQMNTSYSVLVRALASFYAVGDAIVLGMLLRLLMPGTIRGTPAWLLSIGIIAVLLSDVATGLIYDYGGFPEEGVVSIGWAIGYACWGAAALHPAMANMTGQYDQIVEDPERLPRASRVRLALLVITALIAPVYLFTRFFFNRDVIVGVAGAACGFVFLLVLSRLVEINLSHRRSLIRERTLRLAGAGLASASTTAEIGTVVRDATATLLGHDPRRQALFLVREGEVLHVVTTASGDLIPRSELAKLGSTSLQRLRQAASAEPRLIPAQRLLEPAARAATLRMGYDSMLICPLMLTGRPGGDPILGVLKVLGEERTLTDLSAALGILASQVALALERVTLSQEVIRQRGEALFRTLVQDASDVILILDDAGTVRYATPSAAALYGAQVEGKTGAELLAWGDRVMPTRPPGHAPGQRRDPYSGLWRVTSHDGRQLLVEVRYTDLRNNDAVRGRVLTVRDVTEQHHLEEELQHQAFHDALTGLPNRALFTDRAAHALALARRNGTTVAILFIDLDDFKIVNDTMGHAVGDELLIGVAERLTSVARESDTAARAGGDEFALLIENLASPDSVKPFADRVVAAFSEPFELPAGSVLATATVGVATTDDSTDVDQLLRHADLALYAAKSEGKRRWHQYAPVLGAGMVRRRELQAALEEGIARSEFTLNYQPIVELNTGVITGFEALVRWPDPVRGSLPPAEFIGLAEETGLIIPLGSWVLHQAITDLARWRGPDPDPRQPSVSVNVSARQFRDPGFVAGVRQCLDETGLVPSALTLELTESALIRPSERIIADLAELKDIGVWLAIDDFGTGYSSLSYLRDLPFDVLKIDKSFVDGISESPKGQAFAELIIEFAKVMEIEVVAEGIETEAQRDILTEMGCKYGQGFLLAMPMQWREAEALLRAGGVLSPEPHRWSREWT
ncbi:MAG TPA: EAL domain-containing protein [Trebonia sp.]|nr:EAL domain-containing protein [Trebonia sp.]